MARFTITASLTFLFVHSLLSGSAIAGAQPQTVAKEKIMSTDKPVVLVVGASGSIGLLIENLVRYRIPRVAVL
jgi:hypothetical protein